MPQPEKSRAAAFPSGDLPAARPGCNGAGQLFSAAGLIIQRIRTSARLCIAKQNSCPAPSCALLRPPRVQPVSAPGQGIAVKAAIGAADPPAERRPAMQRDDSSLPFLDSDTDPEFPAASPTLHLLDELACHRRAGRTRPRIRRRPGGAAEAHQGDRGRRVSGPFPIPPLSIAPFGGPNLRDLHRRDAPQSSSDIWQRGRAELATSGRRYPADD